MTVLFFCAVSILCVVHSNSLNVLFVSDGMPGHVSTVFELAKGMKHHNVTFLTQSIAKNYIDIEKLAEFRVLFSNESAQAAVDEYKVAQEIMKIYANYSFIDSLIYTLPGSIPMTTLLLNKTMQILMEQRFDVIVTSSLVFGVPVLCNRMRIPCVIQGPVSMPNFLNLNLPNSFALLTPDDMTNTRTRLFNAIFTFRLVLSSFIKALPSVYTLFQSLPQVSGPFHDAFTLRNLLSSNSKHLHLVSIPLTFYPSTVEDTYTKYLGAFLDTTPISLSENDLTRWFKSKPANTVIYGTFGSTSLIPYQRMLSLINGLAQFLMANPKSSAFLAFRSDNYDAYRSALLNIGNDQINELFNDHERVKVERGFVPQKWILQQNAVKIFLSHCGMGSVVESLYEAKTILCLPFNMDQFLNAFTLTYQNLGLSLFVPYLSSLESLITPYDYRHYSFTPDNAREKLSQLWSNDTYQKSVNQMSLVIKHAGGIKRAVEEIEFFVQMKGNLDRYIPFPTTLPFYQRYLLDVLAAFVVIPVLSIYFLGTRLCKQRRKQKTD